MAGESELPDDYAEFVLRIWLEEGNGASFWRGSVQEIDSGQVSHFQDEQRAAPIPERPPIARNGIALAQRAANKILPLTDWSTGIRTQTARVGRRSL